ncbi:MAG TPA: TonB-dependent receptor [Pyrinomonadaceae bacterium]|nr:TonB-dependent receptor [Pyrinomonadaceae bacterium]
MSRKSFSMLLIVLLFAVMSAIGQTVSGTLRGTVTDSNGAVVPNASVTVRSTETGLERTVTTSEDGLYNIPFLPIGQYSVETSRTDFNRVTQNIRISLNETAVLNIRLDPSVSGEVTITAEPPAINSTNQQIAGSLTSEQILERPVANQTNFLTLAETFTGFQENPTSGQNNPTLSSGSSINFNGTGTRGATFQINGVNNDDSSENQNRQGAALATIKEFQVITNSFTAEFGRGYGAVVLVQTLSGTNKIDGSAYLFHNDSALNAKSFFSHGPKPVNRRNQFGGVVGFPIWKNKLFGFVSIDHLENTGALGFTRDVPTLAERNPANWFPPTSPGRFDTPGNRAFIQSVMDRFVNALPNSALGTQGRVFEGQIGFRFPDRDYSVRFDWNATSKDTLFGRYQYTRQTRFAEDIVIGERADQNNKQKNFGLTWTHIFSPELVGEFRYGRGDRKTQVDIAAGNDTPIMRFANTAAISGPIIGNAGAFPIHRFQTDDQFVYNISYAVGGNHFIKAGTDIRFQKLDDLADNFSRGFYNFTTSCQAQAPPTPAITYTNGWQALINGCIGNFQKGYGPFFLENRIGESNFYVEDSWKAFSNLTLNIGARYEYVNAPRERNAQIEYGFSDDKDNIEPRVGFAYSPDFKGGIFHRVFGESGESSIRAGYGIYHGRLFQSVFSQGGATVRFNPPNALFRNETIPSSFFNPTNLQDPTNGFVFVPGPQLTRHSIAIADPNLEMPYTQQWNLTFERQLPWKSALRISYTGNRGIGLLKLALDNLPIHDPNGVLVADHPNNPANLRGRIIRPAANLFCAGTTATTITDQCPAAVTLGEFEYSVRVPRADQRRPDPRYGQNIRVSNGAWSYYHGLQIELSKRLSQGLNFQVAYTWSKAIDTTSEATAVGAGDTNINGPDDDISRALSRFHTPHRFTFFGTYRLPFFNNDKGPLGQILGGWEISSVFKWIHGTPFTVSGAAFDLNLDGFSEVRPVLVDPSVLGASIDNPETAQQILAGAFRIPSSVSDITSLVGRNTFFIDGVKNVDFNVTKRFRMPWEGHSLALRMDMFNALNHVQFGFPNTSYTVNVVVPPPVTVPPTPATNARPRINPLLGQLTSTANTYSPRNIQFSLKYTF